jgi:5-methylthioadenosine/S-adenosylhomocysteine deaminase
MPPSIAVTARVLRDWSADPAPATILVEDGRIAALESGEDGARLAGRAAERLEVPDLIAMPGMVNAHHHAYANVLRGTENSLPLELWALYTVAYGRALDAEAIRLAILLGAAEMIRAGVTACVDHFPHVGNAEAAYAAHRASGMRVGFAPFLHDIHDHDFLGLDLPLALHARLTTPFAPHARLAALFRDLAAQARSDAGRVAILLGPNAPQRCSPALLALWRSLRDELGLGVHTHLLETRPQAMASRARWPGGLVAEMERQGLLAPGLGVAHGIWLLPEEQDLLARHGVVVSHNPASNLMLGSGTMPFADYRARGVTMALGSDSANTGGGANPFELMRLAMMLPRLATRDWASWPTAREVFRMATEGGAAILGRRDDLGRLAPGAAADLVLLDPAGSEFAAAAVGVDAIVQHGSPGAVHAVMIDGRWVYRDGRILAFDEDQVRRDFAARAPAIIAGAAEGLALTREALPVVAKALAQSEAEAPPHS